MKTTEQILARIEELKDSDFFGFERSDLIDYLPFEHAKPYLKDGVTADEWEASTKDPVDCIKEYMDFAWEKANNNRGISASRSMSHMSAWLWLAGEHDFLAKIGDLQDYEYYGKPQLREICEHLEIDWKQYDDGRWTNSEYGSGVGPDNVPRLVTP